MAPRVKYHPNAFAQLRTSPQVMAALEAAARSIADRAGEGFEAGEARVTGGRVRGRATVYTRTMRAMRAQARDHTLERFI